MAILTNSLLHGIRGMIGGQIVFKKYGDKTVLAAPPDFRKRKLSKKQLNNNRTMKLANMYAQVILNDENLRNEAQVRLNVLRNKLYTSLIREYYTNNYNIEGSKIPENPVASLNKPFVNYLLDSTDKSIEEIAQLTGSTTEIISAYKQGRQSK